MREPVVRCGRRLAERAERLPLALPAVAGIVLIDLVIQQTQPARPALAVLDETAHALTALVLLRALGCRTLTPFWAAAVAGSVLIDLDHIPGELGSHLLQHGTPRPYSHSLLLAAALTGGGVLLAGRRRQLLFGLGFGVLAHLLRDLATGGGVPLFWPATNTAVRLPYGLYALVLDGLAVLTTLLHAAGDAPTPGSGPPLGDYTGAGRE